MKYISTRNTAVKVEASTAIARGISPDGGLFVPESFPFLSAEDIAKLRKMSYIERAGYILKLFLSDFTDLEIEKCVTGAYTGSFDNEQPAPIKQLDEKINVLELWHGPTCAFKDLALQLLPYLLTVSVKKASDNKRSVILVATSGDTGKAALEGFKDVPGTEIIVFYPSDGVSPMQKLQMDSQSGDNVHVCAIRGNFDDAQSGVKRIFTDSEIKKLLEQNGMEFSSANSINWGRLLPQIVYYVSAYCDMLERGDALGGGFNVVVPTGNFGNILAAYYAKKIGIPINKLICASNANNVLTDFIRTGVYNRNRRFYTTVSPSMDILISSNLERMLFELSGGNGALIAQLQSQLSESGKYTVDGDIFEKMQKLFYGGSCDDAQTLETIKEIYEKYGYLCDTHTAVAFGVYKEYSAETGDGRPAVIASTASPYKFAKSVLSAVSDKKADDEFGYVRLLSEVTDTAVPAPIAKLENAEVRFNDICEKDGLTDTVLKYLSIK